MFRSFCFLLMAMLHGPSIPLYSQDTSGEIATMPRPDGLFTDGIPRLPTRMIAEMQPYLESRVAYLQDWHPLRKEMLILTDVSGSMQSHIVKMPGGMRRQVTFYAEPTFQSLFDPLRGEYIVTVKDVKGNEEQQIYRQDLADGRTTLLTDGGPSVNQNLVWSKNGNQLFYMSSMKGDYNHKVMVVDPKQPRSNKVFLELEGFGWSLEGISRDGRQMVLGGGKKLWLFDTVLKTKTVILPGSGETGNYSCKGFNANGTGIFLLTNRDSEFSQLAYYDLKTQKLSLITRFNWDVYNAYLSPDAKQLAFIVNEAGNSKVYILDAASRKYQPVSGLPTGVIYGMRWSKDNELLGFHVSSSNANSDIWTWSRTTGKIFPWVQNELGGIDASTIPEPKLIKWKSYDGVEISGFLYPASKKFDGKRPVIIDIHGGPTMQSRPLYNGSGNYYTNELGVAVIYPNIRGSVGYGKTFADLDNGMKREDAVKDVGALLEWIATQPGLDADRVMVTGGSYGGYMTYRTVIEYSSRVRCAIAAFGVSNFATHFNAADSTAKNWLREEYGDERNDVMHAYFLKTAPVLNAERLSMPIFIIQGKNDPRVPYKESEQMVAALKEKKQDVWYLFAEDEGHGFQKKENSDYQFYATIAFIRKYLLN